MNLHGPKFLWLRTHDGGRKPKSPRSHVGLFALSIFEESTNLQISIQSLSD